MKNGLLQNEEDPTAQLEQEEILQSGIDNRAAKKAKQGTAKKEEV